MFSDVLMRFIILLLCIKSNMNKLSWLILCFIVSISVKPRSQIIVTWSLCLEEFQSRKTRLNVILFFWMWHQHEKLGVFFVFFLTDISCNLSLIIWEITCKLLKQIKQTCFCLTMMLFSRQIDDSETTRLNMSVWILLCIYSVDFLYYLKSKAKSVNWP
jgi:hypothetical protein